MANGKIVNRHKYTHANTEAHFDYAKHTITPENIPSSNVQSICSMHMENALGYSSTTTK